MDNQGWIKLYRKLLDDPIMTSGDSYLLQLWIYILLKVNYIEKRFIFNNKEMIIHKGQGIFGLNQIVKDCTIYKYENTSIFKKFKTIYYRRLKILKNLGNLKLQPTNKFTVITVLNWDKYQSNETQLKLKRNSTETPVLTNKNNKNYKININNKQYIEFVNFWNFVFKREYKPIEALLPNFNYWVKIYSLDEIKKAIEVAHTDKFWADKMKPVILLRRKNPQGEAVDYIGGFINKERKWKKIGGDFNG